jgi:uncharacterized protein (DUF58 family)
MNSGAIVTARPRVQPLLMRAWRRLAPWLRPPRRLRFTRAGVILTVTILALGLAALNTANNLLYLVLGALLGLIVVSGWLSEQVLRHLSVERRLPRAAVAGQPVRVSYDITNHKVRFPSLALELREPFLAGTAYLNAVWPGKTARARADLLVARRGVYALDRLTLRTSFPFGLFIKERDIEVRATLTVWPRADRAVREVRPGRGRAPRADSAPAPGPGGGRGEYRSLKAYLPGDDPRDVHWRSSAHLGQPVVREYEREAGQSFWLCLDVRAPENAAAELAVEITAALAARAARSGVRFGLATCAGCVAPASGPAQLENVLDALARTRFRVDAPEMHPPAEAANCVLVTARRLAPGGFADVFTPEDA